MLSIDQVFERALTQDLTKPNGDKVHKPFVAGTTFICHRVNTVDKLKNVPSRFGIEVDVRENQVSGGLMLAHDPYDTGEDLHDFLRHHHHNTTILNIKSERIEHNCIQEMDLHAIDQYFFLDSSFPMMVKLSQEGVFKFATRVSEYEPVPEIRSDWVWVDCFSSCYLSKPLYEKLRSVGKKICVVSPELQGRWEDIHNFRRKFIEEGIVPDAICCKLENIVHWI